MGLQVIGAGLGRTGTYSLKLALEQLGVGPCHHMEEVIKNQDRQVPLWIAAVRGEPDWAAAYEGYESAVDWPTAGFTRELASAYPQARFVLTVRNPEHWYESFSATIVKLLGSLESAPAEVQPFLEMGAGVIGRTGLGGKTSKAELVGAFNDHTDAVKRTLPRERLLVYDVAQGWEPLCRFLGKPVPASPFPKANIRAEFWERILSSL